MLGVLVSIKNNLGKGDTLKWSLFVYFASDNGESPREIPWPVADGDLFNSGPASGSIRFLKWTHSLRDRVETNAESR